MDKINIKKVLINFIMVVTIFLIDRLSKIYILKKAEIESTVDIYITEYLNFYLIWNKGIAFGLFSFNESFMYNLITFTIAAITIIILIMIFKNEGLKKYSLLSIFGGSLGNLFDRIYYSGVPDFIDFHINDFHWFVFNFADIFITIGVLCLIFDEMFTDSKKI
ncbi:signal peptidase II [Candidatus Pelagibacter sp.]|jgi:signal peptidase II|nr:signal peptidase II [Candidatus Pelagibacter sp.]|tara:strand:- start:5250 stop:5738 length:489 start_codon:yes stop_codon:yes gene_type:complete